MIVKLVAYEDEFKQSQDSPKIEVVLYDPTLAEFQEEFKDFVEVVELELKDT